MSPVNIDPRACVSKHGADNFFIQLISLLGDIFQNYLPVEVFFIVSVVTMVSLFSFPLSSSTGNCGVSKVAIFPSFKEKSL